MTPNYDHYDYMIIYYCTENFGWKEVTMKLTFIYDVGNSVDIAIQIGYAHNITNGI